VNDLTIGEGWDAEKVHAHLADLRDRKAREEAISEAFAEAGAMHEGQAYRLGQQITYCVDMFSKPRVVPSKGASDG
jgi:hypothetical protein